VYILMRFSTIFKQNRKNLFKDIVFLPSHLERHIKILKSSLPLGVVLDADADKAINGCVAKNICSKKALAKDGRIQVWGEGKIF